MMRQTKIRGSCPFCFTSAKCATDYNGDERPYSGDFAVCGECGEFMVFDLARRANGLRKPTAREQFEINKNAGALAVRRHWEEKHTKKRAALQ